MSHFKGEEYYQISELPLKIEKMTGRLYSHAAIRHWYRRGLISNHGTKVRLKVARRHRRLYCTMKWLEDFIREVG